MVKPLVFALAFTPPCEAFLPWIPTLSRDTTRPLHFGTSPSVTPACCPESRARPSATAGFNDIATSGDESFGGRAWIAAEESARAASCASAPSRVRFEDELVDVAAYAADACGPISDDGVRNLRPSHLRLQPEARSAVTDVGGPSVASDRPRRDPRREEEVRSAQRAAEATLRWCDDFVADLGLCPWARLSLAAGGAVRIKVVPQGLGLDAFEAVIRTAAEELLRVTGEVGYKAEAGGNGEEDRDSSASGCIDPNTAITFVVAPPSDPGGYDSIELVSERHEFRFDSFHNFVANMEERLFDEADELGGAEPAPIGDLVTIAPFHPRWCFAPEGGDDDSVSWEKRAPFPTVSLVRTSAITAVGEEATKRIGAHNEEILTRLGSHVLSRMFRERVLEGRRDHGQAA